MGAVDGRAGGYGCCAENGTGSIQGRDSNGMIYPRGQGGKHSGTRPEGRLYCGVRSQGGFRLLIFYRRRWFARDRSR